MAEQEKEYLNIKELSDLIGIPVGTLYVWVGNKGIPHIKIGKSLRFKRLSVIKWFESFEKQNIQNKGEFNEKQ